MKLDKFYTKEEIVIQCINAVKDRFDEYDFILEPSAGNGSFLKHLPENKRIGLDIQPENNNEIIKLNFFDYKPIDGKRYLIIGNPPFCDAVNFFNNASSFADCICFILPRIFKRKSILNKLNENFHLTYSVDLPLKCFVPEMNAKCCFQVYNKTEIKREIQKNITSHPDFVFLKYLNVNGNLIPPENADFALKAYGGNCGYIELNIRNLRPKSWHFIKSNINIRQLINNFNSLDYSISKESVRQDTIGKGDLIDLYIEKFG